MSEALFEKVFEIRWADCDANQHMRHSAYSDLCAHTRIGFLNQIGMTPQWFKEHGIGPVLFKEQTEYFREVFLGEEVRVSVETGDPTGSNKSVCIINKVYKPNGELAAQHQVVVGWMDVVKRKVVELPQKIRDLYFVDEVIVSQSPELQETESA